MVAVSLRCYVHGVKPDLLANSSAFSKKKSSANFFPKRNPENGSRSLGKT